MKRKNILLAGILLLFASPVAVAQNASQLIKEAVKTIRDPKNAEMTFSYAFRSNGADPATKKEGKAYLQGDAYKIIMDEQETISNGKTIWTYLVEDGEVMVSDASEGSDNTPVKIITSLDKNYTAKLISTDSQGRTIIELTASEGLYKKATATIDAKKKELKSMTIHADDGSMVDIIISEWKFNQNWPDDFFTFDEKAHPDVEVIDMR